MMRSTTVTIAFASLALLAASSTATAQAPQDLSDPEVAHVAVTANAIDVEMARFAKQHSDNPYLERFAATMISDHTAVNERANKLAGKLGVAPQDNPVSGSLRDGAKQARESLSKLEGDAFARAYIEHEVEYHQAVIDALDNLLIPTTESGELKGLLQDVRPALVAHLKMARQIQGSLGETR